MSASKVIFRKLIITVAVLLVMMFVSSMMLVNSSRGVLSTSVAGTGVNMEQEDADLGGTDDLGDVLDSVVIDYAA